MNIQPRVIRHKDAPGYLGMCEDIFNDLVRPEITVIKIGARGIGYDRYELDAWLDDYVKDEHNIANGNKRSCNSKLKGVHKWAKKRSIPALSNEAVPGTLTNELMAEEFAEALDNAANGKL